jgi:hypothetical protein
MKKVKMHSGCIGQELVAIQKAEPPAPRCQCKKLIEYSEANDLVKQGAAKWVVTKRTRGTIEVDCTFCSTWSDTEKKTCAACQGKGRVMEAKVWEDFNNDIVLMSSTPTDKGKYRMNTRAKTPRVATIEPKHIYRAVVDGLKYAAERIEEYGLMILQARIDMGIKPEPPSDRLKHEGREFDMGIPIVSQIGGDDEPGLEQEELVMDRPPVASSKDPAATDAADGRHKTLLDYSLQKIKEGDYQVTGDRVVAAGISWPKNEIWPMLWRETDL